MRPTTRATIKVCCSMTTIPSVRSSNPASIAAWRLVALQRSIIAGRAAAVAREAKYPVQAFSTKPEARRRRWCCIAAWFAPDCGASPSRQGPLFQENGHDGCCKNEDAARGGAEPLRDRRDPAARPRPGAHVCLGDPQGAPRPAGKLDAGRGGADLADRRGRGAAV